LITAKMRRTGHSSYSITTDRGAPEVADSGSHRPWAGGPVGPVRHWFWHNTAVWHSDRQTGRRTDKHP